jgi:predicted  nucleic acid-binding Zn-ribbon protein
MLITLDNLNDELIKITQLFGETEKVIKTALQGYLYTQCREQLTKAQQHIDKYDKNISALTLNLIKISKPMSHFYNKYNNKIPYGKKMQWNGCIGEEYQLWEQRQQSISKT